MIGARIYSGRKKCCRKKFFKGILSSLSNLSCGSKIYSVRDSSYWRAFLNHSNLPRGSLGLHNHLLHQTSPVTDNFWLSVPDRYTFQTRNSEECQKSKVAHAKIPLKTPVSLWMYRTAETFLYKKHIFFFIGWITRYAKTIYRTPSSSDLWFPPQIMSVCHFNS